MKTLGIYFGPRAITIVDCDGAKVSKVIPIQHKRLAGIDENKVPDELKIVAAIKDELRKAAIDSREANIVLLGNDLIIRTFQMPMLRSDEIASAVKFEAKKYIPFKVEDLIYDYQVFLDKTTRKNLVLFVGVKKENLNKYIEIFAQLDIKVNVIEYAGFSILRLLQIFKIKEKGVVAVVSIDPVENDEVNFIVLENGFPLFSRDIILSKELASGGENPANSAQILEELKVELRISLDFYLRKFPTKNINTIICISPEEGRQDIEAFIKERGIAARFVDVEKLIEKPFSYSLGFLKAFAVAQAKTIKSEIKIDLLPTKIKAKNQGRGQSQLLNLGGLEGFNIKFLLLGGLIIALPFGFYTYLMMPAKQELTRIINSRPKSILIKKDMTFDQLTKAETQYRNQVAGMVSLLNKRLFLTGQLDAIPRVMPEGLWLKDVIYRREATELVLTLSGSVYLGDSTEEMQLVFGFVSALKENKNFSAVFPEIKSGPLEPAKKDNVAYYNFVIECRSKP